MGCLNAKLVSVGKMVPDVPPHTISMVETVAYPPGGGKDGITAVVNGNVDDLPVGPDKVTLEDPTAGALTSKKGQRYKAKFDPRVTAKYDIKALIGRGTYSRVVRVEHRITRQPYAIKMVDRVRGHDMCEAELVVLRRVRHSYIIRLIEVFESVDKLYMVVELATGGELFERVVARGSFTELDAVRVLRMVLEGAGYLHSLGIAHRDLKPENLLYYHPGADSKIMITDFGLSAVRKTGGDPQTAFMHTTCGTPEYIAPEVLARLPYTSQVDMWAIGVITYILLSGTMPFDDENRTRLYRQILRAKYSYEGDAWKDVSAAAREFIDKLLVVDASVRLTAVQALRHHWLTAPLSTKNPRRGASKSQMEHQSTRSSDKSTRSSRSNRSAHSLRSEHRRVDPDEIDALHRDPEFQAELSSLSGASRG
jgi:protein serine kinase H